jgi:hypothetical protein
MRKLFAAAVAALIATGTFATPSEAKTITKPAGVHKVVKVKTVRIHKMARVKPAKAFATFRVGCPRGFWHHHGRCIPMHRHHVHYR